jgi:hypothetical protein
MLGDVIYLNVSGICQGAFALPRIPAVRSRGKRCVASECERDFDQMTITRLGVSKTSFREHQMG